MTAYALNVDTAGAAQVDADTSFIGGKPRLPAGIDIPICKLCGAQQTFFFQVAFPAGHVWEKLSTAVFSCTSCADVDHLIPALLAPLYHAEIPAGFLEAYQLNFRFIVFRTDESQVRQNYTEKIAYKKWSQVAVSDGYEGTKVGGVPIWILDDETPGLYDGRSPLVFLLQLEENLRFETRPGTARQMGLSFDQSGDPMQPEDWTYYELFVANGLYLFGTAIPSDNGVYAIVQGE